MQSLDPYLIFNGSCAEAMAFYAQVLGGSVEMLLTYGASPVADQCTAGSADRVMHARVRFGERTIMASDSPLEQPYEPMRSVSLCLTYDSVEEARRVYDALGVGGEVRMAMTPTFWAGAFAMLVDRYGTPWMINGALADVGQASREGETS